MDDNDGDESNSGVNDNRNNDDDYDEEEMLEHSEEKKEKKKEKAVKKKGLGGPGFPLTPYSQENIYAHADWLVLEKIQSDGYIVEQLKSLLKARNLKVSG
jgi:hypothetical protein